MRVRLPRKILIVDDERSVTGSLDLILSDAGFEVLTAHSFAESIRVLSEVQVDLVITDLRLSDASGIDLITHIKSETPDTEVILMTAYGSLDITIEAIKRGAYYYLEKPYTPDRLFTLIDRALQLATLRRENKTLKRTLAGDSETFGMIGRDSKMRQIIETIRTAAPSDASVLIEGESGTGKELIAAAFHAQSQRASGPFIRINCAAIPHELIESELFGYKKGSQVQSRGRLDVRYRRQAGDRQVAECPRSLCVAQGGPLAYGDRRQRSPGYMDAHLRPGENGPDGGFDRRCQWKEKPKSRKQGRRPSHEVYISHRNHSAAGSRFHPGRGPGSAARPKAETTCAAGIAAA